MEEKALTFEPPQVYTVKQLSLLIKGEIEKIGYVFVRGEVSNAHLSHSGHFYFDLREENYTIAVVLFRSRTKGMLRFPKDGEKVEVGGRVTTYEGKSQYQIIADVVVQRGVGELREAVERLKRKLMAEGLFEPEHKKPLPLLPRRIGVVTSPHGAAIMDIIRTIRRRNSSVHIILYPVRVQGEGAEEDIVRGIEAFNRWGKVDVIIVGRGGGSFEDLMAFNSEKVARAIFASKIPVISAVGHEVDFTIADFVADLRAATPTAAAELVIKSREELAEKLSSLQKALSSSLEALVNRRTRQLLELERALRRSEVFFYNTFRDFDRIYERLLSSLRKFVEAKRRRLSSLSMRILKTSPVGGAEKRVRNLKERLLRLSPSGRVKVFGEKLDSLSLRLNKGMERKVLQTKNSLDALEKNLRMLSPYAVLERGYSIVMKDGKVVKDVAQIKRGQKVKVRLHRGGFLSKIEDLWSLPLD